LRGGAGRAREVMRSYGLSYGRVVPRFNASKPSAPPRPEVEIASVDFVSGMIGAAPFLVAITAER